MTTRLARARAILDAAEGAMPPARFTAILALADWSASALARRLNRTETQMRRWAAGADSIPHDVGNWLERAAAWIESNPAPLYVPRGEPRPRHPRAP